jgi:hypothetical protein
MVEQTEILQLVGRLAGPSGMASRSLVVIDQPAADDGLGHRLAAGAAHLAAGLSISTEITRRERRPQ